MNADQAHILIVYYNPYRWMSRPRLHREFMDWISAFGATLWVAELALGERAFEVTDLHNPNHLQLRTSAEVPWPKESMLNALLRFARSKSPSLRHVMWIDADVRFDNPHFVTDALHELQHAPIVQLFSECIDLGPSYQAVAQERSRNDFIRYSFLKSHVEGRRAGSDIHHPYRNEHCGYAWGADVRFLDMLDRWNPFIDFSIVGSADWQMANCFVGKPEMAAHGQVSDGYKRRIDLFAMKCELHLRRNVSYISGLVRHHWHGRKADRRYTSRWSIVVDEAFDPDLDLVYDAQGLVQFSGRNPRLPLLIRDHSRAKNEDSIDVF